MGPDFAPVSKVIGKSRATIEVGDMTRFSADAFLVPQFQAGASYGGVGGAVTRSGGEAGMLQYENLATSKGPLEFGSVALTSSGGGNATYLIHAVTVGSGADKEFEVIQQATYLSLKTAQDHGVKSVIAPALGTGIIGNLTAEQSAKAMLSGLHRFAQESGEVDFKIVIFGNAISATEFGKVLSSGSYEGATAELGLKEFDHQKWIHEMQSDIAENKQHDPDKWEGVDLKVVSLNDLDLPGPNKRC